MEEAPENDKEMLHSAHSNEMNEWFVMKPQMTLMLLINDVDETKLHRTVC